MSPSMPFSPQVRTKGEEYLVAGRVDAVSASVWRVRGSGSRPYIINSDLRVDEDGGLSWAFLSCSCPHGKHALSEPTCAHVCAVMLHTLLSARGLLAKFIDPTLFPETD